MPLAEMLHRRQFVQDFLAPGRISKGFVTRKKAILLFGDSEKLRKGRDVEVHRRSTLGIVDISKRSCGIGSDRYDCADRYTNTFQIQAAAISTDGKSVVGTLFVSILRLSPGN